VRGVELSLSYSLSLLALVAMVAIRCCIPHSFNDCGIGRGVNGYERVFIVIGRLVIRVFITLVSELISSGVIVGFVVIGSVAIVVQNVEVISVTVSET
jgi:hypothetical protein